MAFCCDLLNSFWGSNAGRRIVKGLSQVPTFGTPDCRRLFDWFVLVWALGNEVWVEVTETYILYKEKASLSQTNQGKLHPALQSSSLDAIPIASCAPLATHLLIDWLSCLYDLSFPASWFWNIWVERTRKSSSARRKHCQLKVNELIPLAFILKTILFCYVMGRHDQSFLKRTNQVSSWSS